MIVERSEFRIRYPLMAQPQFSSGGGSFRVLDVSEGAMRVDAARWTGAPAPGDRVQGRLALAQGAVHAVRGRCQRANEQEVVVLFDEDARIPLRLIFEEQRCLRSRYPDWR